MAANYQITLLTHDIPAPSAKSLKTWRLLTGVVAWSSGYMKGHAERIPVGGERVKGVHYDRRLQVSKNLSVGHSV